MHRVANRTKPGTLGRTRAGESDACYLFFVAPIGRFITMRLSDRYFSRSEMAYVPQMSNALKAHVAEANVPHSGVPSQIEGIVAAVADEGAELLYQWMAKSRDQQAFRQIAGEIEDNLKKAEGVLLVRYTIKLPNGAGQAISEYVGVRVAGTGNNAASAIIAYQARDRAAREEKSPTQCTPNNPLGTKTMSPAVLSAAPANRNMAYSGMVAARVFSVLANNPSNVAAPDDIVNRAYIQETFVFLSKAEWEKIKAGPGGEKCTPSNPFGTRL